MADTWVKFNINDRVRVKLTDHGRRALRENHKKLECMFGGNLPYTNPVEDEHGMSEWQLWELMSEFGSHIWHGSQLVFETNIELCVETEDQ